MKRLQMMAVLLAAALGMTGCSTAATTDTGTATTTDTTADSTDRLLLVKDSFADCMIPFLIPYYREIIVVDADYYQKHVSDLLDKNKITSVLFLYDCNNFVQDDKLSSILTTDKAE